MNHKLTETERVIGIILLTIMGLGLLSGLISCKESNVQKMDTKYQIDHELVPLQVVIIDGCEYLYGPWGNATVLTHKGNCKNHITK